MQSRQCPPPLQCVMDVASQAILNVIAPMVGHTVVKAGLAQLALAEEEAGTTPEGATTSTEETGAG